MGHSENVMKLVTNMTETKHLWEDKIYVKAFFGTRCWKAWIRLKAQMAYHGYKQ